VLAVHADWSVDPGKRWFAAAHRQAGCWRVEAPAPVGDLAGFVARLHAMAEGAPIVLGMDCPIGLPRAYAVRLPADSGANFPDFLKRLADRPDFFRVCATLREVGLERPFYPSRPAAGMSRAAFIAALGATSAADIYRSCDLATQSRPAAAPVFWTLGPNQVGKAAISAWRDLLLPAMSAGAPVQLWPFAGGLRRLSIAGTLTIAEVYPAEALAQVGIRLAGSKRCRQDRAAVGSALSACLERLSARPSSDLAGAIADGFGSDRAGEDRFDALAGLLSVIGVLDGHRPDEVPDDPAIRTWEGWILGQALPPAAAASGLALTNDSIRLADMRVWLDENRDCSPAWSG